jgi:hypothetical protein
MSDCVTAKCNLDAPSGLNRSRAIRDLYPED